MYKYFKELETPENYKICLERTDFDRKRDKYITNACLPQEFFSDYKDVFKRIEIIDTLITYNNEQYLMMQSDILSYEEYDAITSIVSIKDEDYYYTQKIKEKININTTDLENLLNDYIIYCNHLMIIHPKLKKFILETKNILENTLTKIQNKMKIKIEPLQKGITYTFPNAWYITPNGFLYNTGTGHQEGNLSYPFRNICELLRQNKNIPDLNLMDQIKEISKRKYVTDLEFDSFANSIYKIPTILTPEIEHDIERYSNLLKMNEEEFKKRMGYTEWPHIERTYQKNIITLVVGYLAAKTTLFQSFRKINDSPKKEEIIDKLYQLNFDDILVRYCGFHKISSIMDRTITTSTIKSIELFKEYLDKGWALDLIPGIIYDKQKDQIIEMDFNWYYIDKYLDNILQGQNNQIKILNKK